MDTHLSPQTGRLLKYFLLMKLEQKMCAHKTQISLKLTKSLINPYVILIQKTKLHKMHQNIENPPEQLQIDITR